MCFHFNPFKANDFLTCNIENIPTYPFSVAVVGFVVVVVVVVVVLLLLLLLVVVLVVVVVEVVVSLSKCVFTSTLLKQMIF